MRHGLITRLFRSHGIREMKDQELELELNEAGRARRPPARSTTCLGILDDLAKELLDTFTARQMGKDCVVGILFALLPVLGGNNGLRQGIISMGKL
ncbi:hypothetical protein Syun_021483 [Stephania yunnanensis]|uniref:Uncharacterized protein n=1 Tax=Stephania yunnanensis TaxID=152371 RepID=A0AAP0NSB1_9MAGN